MPPDHPTEEYQAAKGKADAALIAFQKAKADHGYGLITDE